MLCPTPQDKLVDAEGAPYFLWDVPSMTVDRYRERLRDPDPAVRAYWLGKLMREGKPDDVFVFVDIETVLELWPHLQEHLGGSRPFWTWILAQWDERGLLPS